MTLDSEEDDLDTEKSTVLYKYAALNWHIHLTAIPEPNQGLLLQTETFLHGREFMKWGKYIYNLKGDAGPIKEVKGLLKLWYTKLPTASQDQLHIDGYFSGLYTELSKFYDEDGGNKVLPYFPLYRLGEFYLMAADPESADKVKKVMADGLTEVLGKRHPLTLRAMSTLALGSIITGRMRDAEKTYSEISRIQLEVVGEDHLDGYESLLYVTLAQYYMTKFEESASNSARSQAGFFHLLGPRHNLSLTGQLYNAYDIAELGRLEEARDLLEDIYKYRVSIFGRDNAMALMAQVALDQVLRKLGDFGRAEHNLEQACSPRIARLQPESSCNPVPVPTVSDLQDVWPRPPYEWGSFGPPRFITPSDAYLGVVGTPRWRIHRLLIPPPRQSLAVPIAFTDFNLMQFAARAGGVRVPARAMSLLSCILE